MNQKNEKWDELLEETCGLTSPGMVKSLLSVKDCESLSINNPEELKLVDQTMRAMGYA